MRETPQQSFDRYFKYGWLPAEFLATPIDGKVPASGQEAPTSHSAVNAHVSHPPSAADALLTTPCPSPPTCAATKDAENYSWPQQATTCSASKTEMRQLIFMTCALNIYIFVPFYLIVFSKLQVLYVLNWPRSTESTRSHLKQDGHVNICISHTWP